MTKEMTIIPIISMSPFQDMGTTDMFLLTHITTVMKSGSMGPVGIISMMIIKICLNQY